MRVFVMTAGDARFPGSRASWRRWRAGHLFDQVGLYLQCAPLSLPVFWPSSRSLLLGALPACADEVVLPVAIYAKRREPRTMGRRSPCDESNLHDTDIPGRGFRRSTCRTARSCVRCSRLGRFPCPPGPARGEHTISFPLPRLRVQLRGGGNRPVRDVFRRIRPRRRPVADRGSGDPRRVVVAECRWPRHQLPGNISVRPGKGDTCMLAQRGLVQPRRRTALRRHGKVLRAGAQIFLPWLHTQPTRRTNVTFYNPDTVAATVALTIASGDGFSVQANVSVPAHSVSRSTTSSRRLRSTRSAPTTGIHPRRRPRRSRRRRASTRSAGSSATLTTPSRSPCRGEANTPGMKTYSANRGPLNAAPASKAEQRRATRL